MTPLLFAPGLWFSIGLDLAVAPVKDFFDVLDPLPAKIHHPARYPVVEEDAMAMAERKIAA